MAKNPMPYDFRTTIAYVGAKCEQSDGEFLRWVAMGLDRQIEAAGLYEPATERTLAPIIARLKEIADELDG